jgi:hypothetical protein
MKRKLVGLVTIALVISPAYGTLRGRVGAVAISLCSRSATAGPVCANDLAGVVDVESFGESAARGAQGRVSAVAIYKATSLSSAWSAGMLM